MKNEKEINFFDFEKIEMRVGTVVSARINEKARKPAYVLDIDFGPTFGIKQSSAQITEAYSLQSLINLQVIPVMNFPPKKVAGVKSDVLVLGVVQSSGPTILLTPSEHAENGSRIL